MRKAVLIVDDSRFARLTLRSIVNARFPDFFVGEAANGAEALAMLDEIKADHILIDYNMPGEDGLAVAEQVRTRSPSTRIALVTANVQTTIAERARTLGLTFIGKPVEADMIAAFLAG